VVSTPRLRDEALAWQAVQPQLLRASRRGIGGILLTLIGSAGGGNSWNYRGGKVTTYSSGDINRQIGKGRMVRYSIAVDEQAKKLTETERVVLRTTGQVPPWFLSTVIAEARKIKI
jgi:hypothetical protein